MPTYATSLDQLLDEVNGLGMKVTFSLVAAGNASTTDPRISQMGAELATEKYRGAYIVNDDGDERTIETITVPTAGVVTITHAGPDWGTEASPTTGYIHAIHPSGLRALANDALNEIPVECLIPLYHGPPDADMQASATSAWTASNSTHTKQVTATEVFLGARSTKIVATANGGGITSGWLNMGKGETGRLFVIGKADIGTLGAAVQSGLHGSAVSTLISPTTTQEDWTYITKEFTLEDSSEQARIVLTGAATSDEGDVQFAWLVKQSNPLFIVPSWLTDFEFKGVVKGRFLAQSSETDAWLADSMVTDELREREHYHLHYRGADANPFSIEIDPRYRIYLQDPLFAVVHCFYAAPYGVSATFAADTDSNPCRTRLLVPYMKHLIGLRHTNTWPELGPRVPGNDLSTPGYQQYLRALGQPREEPAAAITGRVMTPVRWG